MAKSLNIGCSKVYKPGFINIDNHRTELADLTAIPFDLPFEDNSIDTIESYSLIEQLSYQETILSIAEWFRVLKPGAIVMIETLDLESLSIEFDKEEDLSLKRFLMKSFYESATQNTYLKSSYTSGWVKELLIQAGFEKTEITFPLYPDTLEHVRVKAQKPTSYQVGQITNKIKSDAIKQLSLHENIAKFWEFHDTIVEFYIKKLVTEAIERNSIISPELFELISYSPLVTMLLSSALEEKNLIQEAENKTISQILTELDNQTYTNSLYKKYYQLTKPEHSDTPYFLQVLQQSNLFMKELFEDPDRAIEKITQKTTKTTGSEKTGFQGTNKLFSIEFTRRKAKEHLLLGVKKYASKEYNEAFRLFSSALSLNPSLTSTHYNLGLLETKRNRLKAAIEHFSIAQTVDKNPVIVLNKGICLLYLNQYQDCINLLEKLEDDFYEKFTAIGNSYVNLKDYPNAIDAYKWAILSDPLNPIAYGNLIHTYRMMRDNENAEESLKKAQMAIPTFQLPKTLYLPTIIDMPITGI